MLVHNLLLNPFRTAKDVYDPYGTTVDKAAIKGRKIGIATHGTKKAKAVTKGQRFKL